MLIFIDESGSFVCSNERDSWNCIAAYAIPESDRRKMDAALVALKRRTRAPQGQEIKLSQLSDENSYFTFLSDINKLDGLLFAVLVDMGDHDTASVTKHRDEQAELINANVVKMKMGAEREELQSLAERVYVLSPQLYVQLQCQIVLIEQIIRWGIFYYVSRHPKTLGKFRWQIDQKNETRTAFETTFVELTPMLLHTRGSSHPLLKRKGADYQYFDRFLNTGHPGYPKNAHGVETSSLPGINIG